MRFVTEAVTFDLLKRPLLMGVVNVTPDSFSDAGSFWDPQAAADRILQLEDQGADLIDVGAESSRPGSAFVSPEEELRRLTPVLRLVQGRTGIPLSVDTWKVEVAESALDLGAAIINTIRPMESAAEGLAALLVKRKASAVLMHMRATPRSMQRDTRYTDLIGEIRGFFGQCMTVYESAGLDRERILLDPGVGFGKSFEDNMKLISGVQDWRLEFARPILLGCSRKSFLRHFTGPDNEEMRIPNAAIHAIAILKGASILRVHDMIDARRVLQLATQFIHR